MKPIIGITCDFDWENQRSQVFAGYYEVISKCGGIPLLIPCMENLDVAAILKIIDGLLLTGGQDIDSYLFDEEPHPEVSNLNPLRDEIETALIQAAFEIDMPVLGICRGIQVMNIALGGDIYQDIKSQINETIICHNQKGPKWFGVHKVMIEPSSKLADKLCCRIIRANSFHHQAVRKMGKSLIPIAHTADGIIEAIESLEKKFFLGVQWHPEQMWQKDNKMYLLFKSFVDNCIHIN